MLIKMSKNRLGMIFVMFLTTLSLSVSVSAEEIELSGVDNLHRVSDNLYRSAQPTAQGMQSLEEFGIKSVVNLRYWHSDDDLLANTSLRYGEISMNAWNIKFKDAVRFIKIMKHAENHPVLVHCQHGSDRTGAMVAVYRIAVEGWTKDQAIDELRNGGFGFHSIFFNIPRFVRGLDVEKLRIRAGISAPESAAVFAHFKHYKVLNQKLAESAI